MSESEYVAIEAKDIPKNSQGHLLVDVYVFLPTSHRYVRFIAKGDPIESDRAALLENHSINQLFALRSELAKAPREIPNESTSSFGEAQIVEGAMSDSSHLKIIKGDSESGLIPQMALNTTELPPDMKNDVIGKEAQLNLHKTYKDLMDPKTTDSSKVLSELEVKADQILTTVAPDIKDLKKHLVGNLKYIGLMSDSAAITSLAILIALAQGYDSKKSFRDLTLACLIMDSSLAEFTEEQIRQFYIDAERLPADVYARIKKHPIKSYELAESKLKSISDGTMQLILNHHELFNGKGYPRGVRSESLFPMIKVLALAVDIFENIKRTLMLGQKLNLTQILSSFQETDKEPHMRRHNKKLVDSLFKYLEINPQVLAQLEKEEL